MKKSFVVFAAVLPHFLFANVNAIGSSLTNPEESCDISDVFPMRKRLNWEPFLKWEDHEQDDSPIAKRWEDVTRFRQYFDESQGDLEQFIELLKSNQASFHYNDYQNSHTHVSDPLRPIDGVSIICVTHRPADLETIINNYKRQKYDGKSELILVLNGDKYDYRQVEAYIAELPKAIKSTVRTLKDDHRQKTLGDCLNAGIKAAQYNVWTKLDGDDGYGQKYLESVTLPLKYTNASLTGKRIAPFAWWLEERCSMKIWAPHNDGQDPFDLHTFFFKPTTTVQHLYGSTLTGWTADIAAIPFTHTTVGEDTQMLDDVPKKGGFVATSGHDEHVVMRWKPAAHTWRPEEGDDPSVFYTIREGFDLTHLWSVPR